MIPSPYQCPVKLSYGDYEIYTRAEAAINPTHCSKLDVLGRAIFMAGSYLKHFRPCNVVEFVVKTIENIKSAPSLKDAENKMYNMLDHGENGIPYYQYDVKNSGEPINKNIMKRKAYAEAKVFMVELYDWAEKGMI